MPAGPFDLAVIGGGINGAAIARDAVLRGKSVALLEQGDFASGTSSASSKMVHGGIRYLEQLQLGLVYEALRERQTLLRVAPHLVRTQRFLLPIYRGARRRATWIRLGLFLYDALTLGRRLGRSRFLRPREIADAAPNLRSEGLVGGALYFDAVMDDARLCLANVVSAVGEARAAGTLFVARNYARVIGRPAAPASGPTDRRAGAIELELEDLTCGRREAITAHRVVEARGPWSPPDLLVRSKGVHIVLPELVHDHGLLLEHSEDGRVFFVIPWQGFSVVGTTETPFDGDPAHVEVEPHEVAYLLREVRRVFPTREMSAADILGTFAGVRPLAKRRGWFARSRSANATSRTHRVIDDGAGTLTVVGGKYTTYRAVAEEVVDRLFPGTHATTATKELAGGEEGDLAEFRRRLDPALRARPGDAVLERLFARYGCRLRRVLELLERDPSLAEPVAAGCDVLRAEVAHAAIDELAVTPADVLDRRTTLRFARVAPGEVFDGVASVLASYRDFAIEPRLADRAGWLGARAREAALRQQRTVDGGSDASALQAAASANRGPRGRPG